MARLQTEVSKAFWCRLIDNEAEFEEARVGIGNEEPRFVSWFDELFKGGILLQQEKPLTFLITGPPGSGKSTLALELCYRLATDRDEENIHFQNEVYLSRLNTLYISTDSESDQLITNAKSFGWRNVEDRIKDFQGPPQVPMVAIWGKDKIKKWKVLSQVITTALKALQQWVTPRGIFAWVISWIFRRKFSPDILVIDSLNIVEPEDREEFFQQFLRSASKRTKIIIFVLDAASSDKEHKFWEYVCDIVVRLDYTYLQEYYIRTIEILKARYQEPILGKHQVKIYSKPKIPPRPEQGSDRYEEEISDYNRKLKRDHPYRKEGGIFIFPSIHYYLSVYKRLAPERSPTLVNTLPDKLNETLGGLPEGRCTAFIGCRGGHKSHLGYLHLLHRIINNPNESGLVVSLRDDEEMTKETMRKILNQQFKEEIEEIGSERLLANLEFNDQLEILYYPPGYITPEEFFHRMFISLHRLMRRNQKLSVLFNSLDQLAARFPLCAKQEIFVPGMIESLSGEGITSIFIAVEEPGQPAEQYGLLPMADLILSFHLHRFPFEDYKKHLKETWEIDEDKANRISEESKDTKREEIVLQVVRFAGGQRAGAKGLLELVDEDKIDESLYPNGAGLYFTRLSPKFSQGEFVRKQEKGEG
ncbi:MAG: ATPase domain-containing protein [bacterium]